MYLKSPRHWSRPRGDSRMRQMTHRQQTITTTPNNSTQQRPQHEQQRDHPPTYAQTPNTMVCCPVTDRGHGATAAWDKRHIDNKQEQQQEQEITSTPTWLSLACLFVCLACLFGLFVWLVCLFVWLVWLWLVCLACLFVWFVWLVCLFVWLVWLVCLFVWFCLFGLFVCRKVLEFQAANQCSDFLNQFRKSPD